MAITDLLIDGPFQKERLNTSRPWVGSSNQRYHFLTERYLHLKERLTDIPNRLEVRLTPDGRVMVNGLAEVGDLEDLFGGLLGGISLVCNLMAITELPFGSPTG
ncbi:radical SAM protein [Paenibacillus eucommiae]|uniref:BON domain-containing protein n=1 Tax=Paenibacillus eucommiae TaxID=1355755 RepID=A0ABS4J2T5_9BACL|nr:radical SAM protein [Paenibacillus eucommiae]MBP1994145.1 hypothetical protein [Paenibacillus eucommiae]